MVNKRLGKGLEALITSYSTDNERYVDGAIPIDEVLPNKNQPRKDFNEDKITELSNSIKASGILQPLTVRETKDGKYELIAGERRLKAAKKAGLKTVPAYILSITADVEMMEYALIENVQRVDLSPLEEAEGYAILSGKYNLSQDEIARRVGKSRPTITNSLRLLKLPSKIKLGLRLGKISSGHARVILSLQKSLQMMTFYHKIISEKLSVRQSENLVKKYIQSPSKGIKKKKIISTNSEISKIENNLISYLGTKVIVQMDNKGKGKIHIDFYSESDLDRIIEIISKL